MAEAVDVSRSGIAEVGALQSEALLVLYIRGVVLRATSSLRNSERADLRGTRISVWLDYESLRALFSAKILREI